MPPRRGGIDEEFNYGLLLPMARSLFGIGVVQDSAETALNSSTDVLFTAAACIAAGDVEESAPQLACQNG
ncbi:hypothetical protein PQU99_09940 [Vogesella sp. LYT10W]|nr:hypothetical protein [Vogesella indigofera]MDC7711183.1 hypothetical protein [Vogesella indigofera]